MALSPRPDPPAALSELSALGLSLPQAMLAALCRADPAVPASLAGSAALRDPDFLADLGALAQRHGVFGLILLELDRAGLLSRLPSPLREQYANTLRALRRQAALWDLERDFVLTLLGEHHIPVVLLKGGALRLTAYSDSVQRPFGDLDILVPEDTLDEAIRILRDGGYTTDSEQHAKLYREHHHHLILRKPLGFIVEVHWALEPVDSPFLLDPVAFLRDAVVVKTSNGQSVQVPSPAHCVLHLSTQNAEDGFALLRRIVDVDRVIARQATAMDWNHLASEAIRMKVNGLVAVSLRLSELLLGTRLPTGVTERLELSALSRANLALLDPLGSLLGQRARQRSAWDRLLLLWILPDQRTRRHLLRSMRRGDWFNRFLHPEEGGVLRRTGLFKLGLYQLWVYLQGTGAWLAGSRRVRRFWRSGP